VKVHNNTSRLPVSVLLQAFLAAFQQQQFQANTRIQECSQQSQQQGNDVDQAAVQGQLDGVALELAQMEKAVAEASYFLPSYDQKQCSLHIAVSGPGLYFTVYVHLAALQIYRTRLQCRAHSCACCLLGTGAANQAGGGASTAPPCQEVQLWEEGCTCQGSHSSCRRH
jgi:hypothetical protein